ncbi:MAG: MmgE/PrpD family protein [Phycisphaeraceae bacterium]|nr:MmgE/PrpD family protein [Phycisphaeraceae bacterium]MCW5762323.1 MmgE/PrpD family protein [Phycisphaeraceae bacterium]
MSENQYVTLPADSNQALGIARYAIDFLSSEPGKRGEPGSDVLEKTTLFHTDAALCGLSALALGTNAPTILRREALTYSIGPDAAPIGRSERSGATVFGSRTLVQPEKAIVANAAAVREWDSNGTNFGYNPRLGHTAGEFGHNDFYPVCIAAAQMAGRSGADALKAMICLDEIRGRLAEVFSLKSYKVDHVVHGAIASAAVFGAMLGATAEQIESAIGMTVAHYIPFRAIRAGKQLSDSKGASAAISTEAAVLAMRRSMMGFLGPRDIFRNPEAIFRMFEGPGQMFVKVGGKPKDVSPRDSSPFELVLGRSGSDFAVMGMHFKLGLYEHQSAGALQAMITLLGRSPKLLENDGANIRRIRIVAYEPAFGIIGDPAKRDPKTRQSADHSMVYIVATLLRKAIESKKVGWTELMLEPADYCADAIFNKKTRALMDTIEFAHGGPEYDAKYPDGIPTSVVIEDSSGALHDSGLVMYPGGHARNVEAPLRQILDHKFGLLGALAFDEPKPIVDRFMRLASLSAAELATLHDFVIQDRGAFE